MFCLEFFSLFFFIDRKIKVTR